MNLVPKPIYEPHFNILSLLSAFVCLRFIYRTTLMVTKYRDENGAIDVQMGLFKTVSMKEKFQGPIFTDTSFWFYFIISSAAINEVFFNIYMFIMSRYPKKVYTNYMNKYKTAKKAGRMMKILLRVCKSLIVSRKYLKKSMCYMLPVTSTMIMLGSLCVCIRIFGCTYGKDDGNSILALTSEVLIVAQFHYASRLYEKYWKSLSGDYFFDDKVYKYKLKRATKPELKEKKNLNIKDELDGCKKRLAIKGDISQAPAGIPSFFLDGGFGKLDDTEGKSVKEETDLKDKDPKENDFVDALNRYTRCVYPGTVSGFPPGYSVPFSSTEEDINPYYFMDVKELSDAEERECASA